MTRVYSRQVQMRVARDAEKNGVCFPLIFDRDTDIRRFLEMECDTATRSEKSTGRARVVHCRKLEVPRLHTSAFENGGMFD